MIECNQAAIYEENTEFAAARSEPIGRRGDQKSALLNIATIPVELFMKADGRDIWLTISWETKSIEFRDFL